MPRSPAGLSILCRRSRVFTSRRVAARFKVFTDHLRNNIASLLGFKKRGRAGMQTIDPWRRGW